MHLRYAPLERHRELDLPAALREVARESDAAVRLDGLGVQMAVGCADGGERWHVCAVEFGAVCVWIDFAVELFFSISAWLCFGINEHRAHYRMTMLADLAALDSRCNAVLDAWYKDETSDGWGELSDAQKSVAGNLLRMMENVFKVYYDSNFEDQNPDDAGYGSVISDDYVLGWDLFVRYMVHAVNEGLHFNGMSATLYVRMRSDLHSVIVEEIAPRPCAIGHVFLYRALVHIGLAVMKMNRTLPLKRKKNLIVRSFGIGAQMVEKCLLDTAIHDTGNSWSARSEWIIPHDEIRHVVVSLETLGDVNLIGHDSGSVGAFLFSHPIYHPLPKAADLNTNSKRANYDAALVSMIKKSKLISGLLYLVPSRITPILSILNVETRNLIIFKDGNDLARFSVSEDKSEFVSEEEEESGERDD